MMVAKIFRRPMRHAGCCSFISWPRSAPVAIKNAVHALPAGEQAQEDFEWLLREIREGGGEALICEARLVDGLSDEEVQAMFSAAREADYDALAKEVRAFSETLGGDAAAAALRTRLARLK